jgi:hypothetical protein
MRRDPLESPARDVVVLTSAGIGGSTRQQPTTMALALDIGETSALIIRNSTRLQSLLQ